MSFQNLACLHLPRIDCFSQYLGFSWKGKNKYSTQLGAFLTFALVIYFACFTVFYWLQYQDQGSQYYLKMEEQVDQVNIIGSMSHSKQYIIAFGLQNIQNQINYNDISYYNIQAKYFVENTNQDILERQLQGINLPLFKCNDIQINDDALQDLKKLENYLCTDLANVDIAKNDILNHISIDFNICTTTTSNQCQDPNQIEGMIKDNVLTVYFPRIAISKNDRSTIKTIIEKKYYWLYQNAQQKINFQLRSSYQESSKNILLYYQQKNSWLNMINYYESVEYQDNQPGSNIIIASIIIGYDQIISETYRVQNYEIIDFIAIIVSQTLFLYFIFSQVNSYNSQKNINKEINDRLLQSKETESKLLLKLISKAKEMLAKRKCDGNKFQPVNDKKQELGQLVEDNQVSIKEKKEVIMNTDNFYQFDANNMNNRSHEFINSNNVSFIPNYFGFELQQVIRPGRSSRYSIANHELGNNIKKKSTYDHQSTLQPFKQQKSNMQSVHNLINRKKSKSIAKLEKQGMNSGLIQQPRESVTNAGRNSLLIPSPSLQNINSQIQVLDQSGQIAANYPILNNNFNNILTERVNTVLLPQNIDSKGGTFKHSSQRKDLELINDGDNITPFISEKQPHSTKRNSVSNLVKIDLKQIQKKDFSGNEDINNQDFENDASLNYFQNNPNGGFQSFRSKQQSLFGVSSLKKKQSLQLQGFNIFPQISHQYSGAANFVNNRLPIINLNAVQQDNNHNIAVNSIPNNNNNNLQINNCNCNLHNCNKNVNININNNITNNMNQQNGLCIAQARNSKIKFDNKSQIQKLEKVEEDYERDHEQSTKKRLSIHELDFVYFSSLEKDNQKKKKQVQYPLLNEINLIKILEKLMEFERLKNILLDQKQLAIFEYIVQSPIQRQEYFDQFFKNSNIGNNNNQVTQNQHNIGSFNTTSSSRDQVYFHEETIIKGWKAMVEIEKQKNKSDLDLRLINSVNQNIYLLVNLSNLDDVLQQSQEQKNNRNELFSNQLINLNKTVEYASLIPIRARGLADAIQRNQRSLSESSCNKIIADENFNY
ncbi:hypothetical protein ABPG72_009007 [Tetrahymena utriculariae]